MHQIGFIYRIARLYRYDKVLLRIKNFAVVGNCVASCMLSHNNVDWAADHRKHNSQCCCKIHVRFSFTLAQSDRSLEDLQWKLCSAQWWKVT